MRIIDLRSDTVTRPSQEMRRVMANAEVGDDMFGEDPTVRRLQECVADLLGMEAGLFLPSGTMSNQIAIRLFSDRGDRVCVGKNSHITYGEEDAARQLFGVQIEEIGENGFFDEQDVQFAGSNTQKIALVIAENTHTALGGAVFPFDQLQKSILSAKKMGAYTHMDGARLLNAVVATGIPASDWAKQFDSVSLCLSKGLGCPVGSVICSKKDTINKAIKIRKMLGGGMRQVGVLAAAGLFALENNVNRLKEDHVHAHKMATGLKDVGFSLLSEPSTSMVLFCVNNAVRFCELAKAHKLLLRPVDEKCVRAVFHLDVRRSDVDVAISVCSKVYNEMKKI